MVSDRSIETLIPWKKNAVVAIQGGFRGSPLLMCFSIFFSDIISFCTDSWKPSGCGAWWKYRLCADLCSTVHGHCKEGCCSLTMLLAKLNVPRFWRQIYKWIAFPCTSLSIIIHKLMPLAPLEDLVLLHTVVNILQPLFTAEYITSLSSLEPRSWETSEFLWRFCDITPHEVFHLQNNCG